MNVRQMRREEILDGLHLVWEVFAESLAPSYSEQGVREFQNYIRLENILAMVDRRELLFFGAWEGEILCGVCAVQSTGHISLLFVKKEYQRKGAARMLVQAVWDICVSGLSLMQITVNAAPTAVEIYRHLGFRQMGPEQEAGGIRYVPMEKMASPADVRPAGGKQAKKRTGLIVGIVLAVIVLLGILGFAGYRIVSGLVENFQEGQSGQDRQQEDLPWSDGGILEEEPFEDTPSEDTPSEDASGGEGIEGINCYVAENLPYTIEEETYTYSSDGSSGEYPMEFDIAYPQISGMENTALQDEINQILEDCAMSTVNTLYLNPSDDLRESMLEQSQPFLASQVTYQLSYADSDFISVTFSDHYFAGSIYAEFQDLRTRNISLSDGTVYETSDIVDINDDFLEIWKDRMEEEAPGATILSALSDRQFRQILGGEILENRYYDNFFVDADGIQIGLTYHYNSQDDQGIIARGWITAPFERSELEPYQTDSSFWEAIKD